MRKILTPCDYTDYLNALNNPPLRIARKNPLKEVSDELIKSENGDFPTVSVSAKPGKGALYAAGAYYVQEPAAAAVAEILPPMLPDGANVLDMCAAPGGKVTAAASLRPDCNFLANEVIFSRAKILLSNVERLGLRNCTVTSLRPDEVACRGENLFDAVIADVPCSGEGMLRKAEFYSSDLSDDTVTACAERAKKYLTSATAVCVPEDCFYFLPVLSTRRKTKNRYFILCAKKGTKRLRLICGRLFRVKALTLTTPFAFFRRTEAEKDILLAFCVSPKMRQPKLFAKKQKTQTPIKTGKLYRRLIRAQKYPRKNLTFPARLLWETAANTCL